MWCWFGIRLRKFALAATLAVCLSYSRGATFCRELPVAEYRSKLTAGWIGQMAGVAFGAPTEFKWPDKIIPEEAVPRWEPGMINDAFAQDDIYVEMTFLRTLDQHGLDVSIRQAGIDFANSSYPLWCANLAGRSNLRKGIAPPDSGHPSFNKCPNDIDYQIEADFSGLIAPGMPQAVIQLGEKFGHIMNYGDGLYAGQFIGAMYAEAFFETNGTRIIQAALKAIPQESQYAQMARDLLAWHQADPTDWEKTWQLIQQKYRQDPAFQKASNGGIDCKINGAYVLLGLLYGGGCPLKTMTISCRAGQDSDCNPSTSAGVLFASLGLEGVPEEFKSSLSRTNTFSHTTYTFPQLLEVCEKLARKVVVQNGGRIERAPYGEVFVIPVRDPAPSPLELSWAPGPTANSRFTRAEMKKIKPPGGMPKHIPADVNCFAKGWTVSDCGPDMNPGLRNEWGGKSPVLVVHPADPSTPCVLSRKASFRKDTHPVLQLTVANDPKGDFQLIVQANGKELLSKSVNKNSTKDGWLIESIDLSAFAGQKTEIRVLNQPTGWSYEAAYFAGLSLTE